MSNNQSKDIEYKKEQEIKDEIAKVARRMCYEKLIEGQKNEEALKKKDDKHVELVLNEFGIKLHFH